MFVTDKVQKEGMYGINMYNNGEEELVILDNQFPTKNNKPVFAKSHSQELWPMILEKVWAKTHGGYQEMCQGQTYEVFHDLLGAPSFYFKTNDYNIWKILLDGEKRNYIMAATALP